MGSVPGSGRPSGGGNGNPLQYSCLEKFHGQRSLAGYSLRGCKQSDTTEGLNTHTLIKILNRQTAQTISQRISLLMASQVVLVVRKLSANAGDERDVGFIPESGRSPGGGHGNPLQYPYLENPMERGVQRAWSTGSQSPILIIVRKLKTNFCIYFKN